MQIEPGTSPKHRYELIKATLLVIIGALITITVVYGIDYFSPKAEPDPIAVVEPVSSTEPIVEDIDTTNQETTTEKVYSQEELNKIFEMDKKKPGTKLFYSDKLGVGFTYAPAQVTDLDSKTTKEVNIFVRELDNKIYIVPGTEKANFDPSNWSGFSLEVFNKDKKDSLQQAITKDFLVGANTDDCFVSRRVGKMNPDIEKIYVQAEIAYRIDNNSNDPMSDMMNGLKKCPEKAQNYARVNADRYFVAERGKDSSKYGFISLSQDPDIRPLSGFSNNTGWEITIRFLK